MSRKGLVVTPTEQRDGQVCPDKHDIVCSLVVGSGFGATSRVLTRLCDGGSPRRLRIVVCLSLVPWVKIFVPPPSPTFSTGSQHSGSTSFRTRYRASVHRSNLYRFIPFTVFCASFRRPYISLLISLHYCTFRTRQKRFTFFMRERDSLSTSLYWLSTQLPREKTSTGVKPNESQSVQTQEFLGTRND